MTNKRFGLKEVANVAFFDLNTGKPVIFFDTLKVVTIENTSESAEARGGWGNGRLISWDYGRTATLTIQDAVISDASLALLSGNQIQKSNIKLVGRETLVVQGGKITLKEANVDNLTVMKVERGVLQPDQEITVQENLGGEVTLTGVQDGDTVMAFYEYTVNDPKATKIVFSSETFPSTYRVVGDVLGKDQYGSFVKSQFVIPQAKLQSGFTFTMDAENVSTFDFTLDVLQHPETGQLYYIVNV